jgi:hypothetical protein
MDPDRPVLSADYPEGFRRDSPAFAITDRSRGGVLVFVDGLPGMGKTVLLQHFAQQMLGSHRVFWWGELRPQWLSFYPEHYQLLVPKGLVARLYAQTVGSDVEDTVEARAVTGLSTREDFYRASRKDLLNVLTFSQRTREYDVLDFLEWLTQRREGVADTAVFLDEVAKIAPGATSRLDGSYDRGLRLASILENTRKSHVSVLMSSHAPSDLWYVCMNKVQFHVAAAGRHHRGDLHSPGAQARLSVGDFFVNGPTPTGKRYDLLHVERPPASALRPFILRSEPDELDLGWGGWTPATASDPHSTDGPTASQAARPPTNPSVRVDRRARREPCEGCGRILRRDSLPGHRLICPARTSCDPGPASS